MSDYFVLDENKQPRPASLMEWGRMFQDDAARRVDNTTIGGATISTVFLGLDHGHGFGPPQFFETMIFGGEHDHWMDRCTTWDQAVAMHERACALVRGNIQ